MIVRSLLAGLLGVFLLSSPAARAAEAWRAEWEKTVEGAKKEGKLTLYLYQGDGELSAVAEAFQKTHPGIAVTMVTGRGSQLGPRIMAEHRAGKFLADVYIGGPTTPYGVFYRAKILDPVRSALILPEVVDESKWWEGKHHYIDPEDKYIFIFLGNVGAQYISYNANLVKPGEIRSYWDFIQPKWKGKIL